MPLLTRLFLKTGVIYFIGAMAVGIWLQWDLTAARWLNPLFWHMLAVGWVSQIIFGVSHWMFPLRDKDETFSTQKWMWLTYITLNTGLLLRVISEPLLLLDRGWLWKLFIVISAMLQLLAGIGYVIEIWPRVLSKKQQILRRKQRRTS